jgi:hypothetical protein
MNTETGVLKTCKKCGLSKDENEFYIATWDKTKRRATCIACHKQYHNDNLDTIRVQRKSFRETNKERLSAEGKTDERRAGSRASNLKRRLAGKVSAYEKAKRKSDPLWKIRKNVSSKISRMLATNGQHKHASFLKCIPYTLEEMQKHLQDQFEPWMNWNNYGPYRVSIWKDNDVFTWTWSIDHIIPQSDLPYSSMLDENFQKCWALENLRPLSAKQNLKDGTQKVRHNKI